MHVPNLTLVEYPVNINSPDITWNVEQGCLKGP